MHKGIKKQKQCFSVWKQTSAGELWSCGLISPSTSHNKSFIKALFFHAAAHNAVRLINGTLWCPLTPSLRHAAWSDVPVLPAEATGAAVRAVPAQPAGSQAVQLRERRSILDAEIHFRRVFHRAPHMPAVPHICTGAKPGKVLLTRCFWSSHHLCLL